MLLVVAGMGIGIPMRGKKRATRAIAIAVAALAMAGAARAGPRVFSLDQCADQGVRSRGETSRCQIEHFLAGPGPSRDG